MEKSFKTLGIIPPILKAIEKIGYQNPTEVQEMAIPGILKEQDTIVISKTGSGKTAVFGIPILQMADPQSAGPEALIITPTRELAVQVDNDLRQLGKFLPHKMTAVYGQHNINTEIRLLKQGVSIITGTPGRIFDHISHKNFAVDHIRYLVLDEADRMLDMGFIQQIRQIIRALPENRITLLFSATMPAEIQQICRSYMKNPSTIEVASKTKTVDAIEQGYYHVRQNEKRMQLERILAAEKPDSCIIFCNTRITVDKVQSFLARKGFASRSLHGDIPQNKRLRVIQEFKSGSLPILVATDVAARGIHIEELSLVINYDLPENKDNYIHRIGRTGRAGKDGKALSLVTGEDIMTLYEIEEHIGTMIEERELPPEVQYDQKRQPAKQSYRKKAPATQRNSSAGRKTSYPAGDSSPKKAYTKHDHGSKKIPETKKAIPVPAEAAISKEKEPAKKVSFFEKVKNLFKPGK